jgi:DNA topoisomerase-1
VKHGKTYANLEAGDDVTTVGLNRAVSLIEDKKKNPGKGRRRADPGRSLGEHPQKGGVIVAKNGRYGPYVSHDGVNANLPADKTPEVITLDEAAALIDARAERTGGGRSTARRNRPARGETAKSAAPKAAAKPKKRAAQAKLSRKAKAEAAE